MLCAFLHETLCRYTDVRFTTDFSTLSTVCHTVKTFQGQTLSIANQILLPCLNDLSIYKLKIKQISYLFKRESLTFIKKINWPFYCNVQRAVASAQSLHWWPLLMIIQQLIKARSQINYLSDLWYSFVMNARVAFCISPPFVVDLWLKVQWSFFLGSPEEDNTKMSLGNMPPLGTAQPDVHVFIFEALEVSAHIVGN